MNKRIPAGKVCILARESAGTDCSFWKQLKVLVLAPESCCLDRKGLQGKDKQLALR